MPGGPGKPAFEREPGQGQVAVGRALGPWGLRGHIKVEPMTDFEGRFAVGNELNLRGESKRILDIKQRKRQLLVQFEGITSPEQAASFSGALLTVSEVDLPPLGQDEYYRFQLVGLPVKDTSGATLGTVSDLLDTGETQVLVVTGEQRELLVPLVDDFVTEIDLDQGIITADTTNL